MVFGIFKIFKVKNFQKGIMNCFKIPQNLRFIINKKNKTNNKIIISQFLRFSSNKCV